MHTLVDRFSKSRLEIATAPNAASATRSGERAPRNCPTTLDDYDGALTVKSVEPRMVWVNFAWVLPPSAMRAPV